MTLTLSGVRLDLASFTLEVNATLSARVTGLFGPSGAGKTSLLDLIAGLRRAQSAVIRLGDEVLTDTGRRIAVPTRARRIGYVPQDGALFPHRSVRENLLYGERRGLENGGPTLGHVVEVLALGGLLERGVGQLSGGERQRVSLGRALLSGPRLLLLDEPLASLDQGLKQRILPYLKTVRDEFQVPMLYVSHQADEIVALADEVLVLDRGRTVRQGTPAEVFRVVERPAYEIRGEGTGAGAATGPRPDPSLRSG